MIDLKRFILDKNISQRDLCNAIGYSEAYVSRVLSGASPMNEKFEAIIRKAYPDYFEKPMEAKENSVDYQKNMFNLIDPVAPTSCA